LFLAGILPRQAKGQSPAVPAEPEQSVSGDDRKNSPQQERILMNPSTTRRSSASLCAVALAAVFSAAAAPLPSNAQENAPCAQIKAACTGAGFTAGKAKDGVGLMADCVNPIMQGVPQRPKAAKPLPQVDPALVAACKAKNPNFGQPKAAPDKSPAGITD
jgi:hypothetical protein